MTRARAWIVALAAVSLPACATVETGNDRTNPEEPLWFHRPAGAINVVFSRVLTASTRAAGDPYERGRPEIDVGRHRLFIGSSDGGLYAIRAGDGSSIWRFETLNAVQCEPLYDPELDVVYFGSNDGALYAVHASDGRLMWRYDSGAEIARRPVRVGEMLYFANAADNLFAIERRAGQGVWHVHRTPAFGMEISGYAGPSFDRGTIFFAFSDGHVGAYDARDGSERWPAVDLSAEAEQSQGSEGVRYLDVDTTPVPDDLGEHGGAVVFVASFVGGVFAIDQERGTTVWRADKVAGVTELTLWHEPGHRPHEGSPDFVPGGPPVPSRELLIASSGTTGLWALDPMTGRSAWHIPVPEGGVTAPAIVGGALLVGTTRYGAFLLSPRDGRPMDGVDLGSGFSQTPVAFGGRAYLFSNAGTILALEIDPPLRPQRDTWTWP